MTANWIVRHGAMRFLGEFDPEDAPYARGDEVVVRTDRGLELGQVLSQATPRALELIAEPTRGRIVRRLTETDRAERVRVKELEKRELANCERFVAVRKLQMVLVDV